MPLTIPSIDDRRYQDLLNEALARIPVHNPEWTNFNKSDPGVTLLELFAFLTENLLYRSNQIPERNRRKFLQLLGVPLQPASSALGLVSFNNDRGPLETITLNSGLEVRAGQVPFRTDHGLDVLPIETAVYYKQTIVSPDTAVTDYYKLLYASYNGQPPNDAEIQLYQSVPIDGREGNEVAIGQDATDRSAWVALMVRASDKPVDDSEAAKEDLRNKVREAIAGKTISLGIVPAIEAATRVLAPGGSANPEGEPLFQYLIPNVRSDGLLPTDPAQRVPQYRPLVASPLGNVLEAPGVVEITLPSAAELKLWSNLDPLEQGVADFPPSLEDSRLNDRVIIALFGRHLVYLSRSLMPCPSTSSAEGLLTMRVPGAGPSSSSTLLPRDAPTCTGTTRTFPSSIVNSTLRPSRSASASAATIFLGFSFSVSSLISSLRKLTRAAMSGRMPSSVSLNFTLAMTVALARLIFLPISRAVPR